MIDTRTSEVLDGIVITDGVGAEGDEGGSNSSDLGKSIATAGLKSGVGLGGSRAGEGCGNTERKREKRSQ